MTDQGRAGTSLTQRRLERTRLEVAQIALELSHERGWDAVAVSDLVAAAGISLRTFYRYFARKEDVFVPLLDEATARLQKIFTELEGQDDLASRSAIALEQSLSGFPGGLVAAHGSYGILLGHADLTPVWLAAVFNAEPGFARAIGIAFPGLDDGHDGRLVSAVIIACQRIALIDWVNGPADSSLTALAERAIRTGLQPISTPTK